MNFEAQNDQVATHIINTLLYFDIFNYPLTPGEVHQFLQSNHVSPETIHDKLHALVREGFAFQVGPFFSVQDNAALAERRIKGNEAAKSFLARAIRQGQLIASFPFVRGVMASGSLSKGYMDEACDLDFFVITAPGRLWIARTLLVLYKRIFLRNSHKYFCVNYFVDEEHLEIEEQNLYTATELVTLMPLAGHQHYVRLMKENAWVTSYLPNSKISTSFPVESNPPSRKKWWEQLLSLCAPDQLDSLFMRLTFLRWKRHYSNYPKSDFEIAFKTKRYVSKNHPNYFQGKVLHQYEHKRKSFEHDPSIR